MEINQHKSTIQRYIPRSSPPHDYGNPSKSSPSPNKKRLGAERLAAVVHLVRRRHFLRVVVNADVVAPEGLLAQLVLRIDLGEATGNSPGC